ncbi:RNA polymerase sigma factor [Caulobacter sp. UC70_42]|uniref:RNA polymerase sigma factor n=1 Tax=Caulobacter sp. UC70_42 TaxID=3374551 RepID=UPI0037583C24
MSCAAGLTAGSRPAWTPTTSFRRPIRSWSPRRASRTSENPKAYLFQVAYSLLVRHVQRSRIVSIRAVADLERLDLPAEMASPEQVLIDRDELHRLAEAIAEMPKKTQEAFILRRVQGLSQREIAARMGVSENTVEKHIVKGIRLLIDRFGRGGKRALGASRNDDTGTSGLDGGARDKSGG